MKKVISLLLALALCASILQAMPLGVSAADGDEIRAAKKIISVVYDDSGSMKGDRWVYSNYAMQALTALLNQQDELYITYMSRPSTSSRVDLSDIAGAVKDIRKWSHYDRTPGESLDTAREQLDSISESEASTQFWLVILTDGEISELNMTLQEKLDSMKGDRMSNGTSLNVAYLAMGPGAVSATADKGRGLYAYAAADSASISTTMSEIANLISGRITANNVTQVDDRTISFHSDLPLYNISILSQDSAAKVTSAASAEQALDINRNIALDAYEPFGTTALTLFGNAAVINLTDSSGVSQVIQAGTYTVTFSEPVRKQDLLVQYEPAIGLKLLMTRGGVEVSDPSDLLVGDQIAIEVVPVVPGTDDRIDASTLPKGISWMLEYVVDDHIVDSANGSKLPGITIREGENVIRATMQIPGFAPFVRERSFLMELIVYNFGIQTDQPDPLRYYRSSIGDGSIEGGELTFRITNDGAVLSKADQKAIGVKLEVTDVNLDNSAVTGFFNRIGFFTPFCTLKQCDDGSYILNPAAPFAAFLIKAGEYTVTVAVDRDPAVTATGTFTLVPRTQDWIDLISVALFILFLWYLIFILFIKYRFNNQTVYYEVFKPRSDGGGIELVSEAYTMPLKTFPLNRLLFHKRACEAKFYGLTLQAGPGGTVIITGKSIAKVATHYGPSSVRPTTSLHSISSSLRATQAKIQGKTEVVASDLELTVNRPIYFRTEGNRNIWRIRLQN